MIDELSGLVGSMAAVGGVWVAWAGLRTWRSQLLGTAEYELARRILRCAFSVRDQILAVRSPFISPGEMVAALKAAGVDFNPEAVGFDSKTEGLVYAQRWDALARSRSELSVALLEGEVLWGAEVRKPERALSECIGELYSAVMMHVRRRSNREDERERLDGSWERRQAILYAVSSEPEGDAFSAKVAASVTGFETLLRVHLRTQRPIEVRVVAA